MKELKPLGLAPCKCQGGPGKGAPEDREAARRARKERAERVRAEALAPPASLPGKLGLLSAALIIWWHLYGMLPGLARFVTVELLGLDPAARLGASVEFFVYDTPKVLLLLTLVVFGVGVLRSFFTAARARRLLAGGNAAAGHLLAALLGVVTPFCSCSAVPMFIGFLNAGVPLGVAFSFIIAAPMVNEVALALLWSMLGWKVAALYAGAGLGVAVLAGFVIGRLGLEAHLEDWVRLVREDPGQADVEPPSWADRLDAGARAVRDIVGKVWLWVVAGIAVGAGIHGYVPQDALAAVMGREAWWSVPVATLLGVPMYSNAAGIVPVVQALLAKGAALGMVLAFMMSVIALSLPEMVILRRVLKPRLLAAFVGVVSAGIMLVGYLFNAAL